MQYVTNYSLHINLSIHLMKQGENSALTWCSENGRISSEVPYLKRSLIRGCPGLLCQHIPRGGSI